MAKYGNSKGNNKGKKYIKLKGGEVATPEAQAAADEFLFWFGCMGDYIKERLISPRAFDEDVLSDTVLQVYEAIRLKGLIIRGKKRAYFLRAYHTARLTAIKKQQTHTARYVDLDVGDAYNLEAPDYDYESYEQTVDKLRVEMLDFVRAHYDPAACSIFEIYMELQPSITYKSLAEMLGIPQNKVWATVRDIKSDLVYWFGARREYLLSM